jgi:ADP-heptose:LPS heptosyltransferase
MNSGQERERILVIRLGALGDLVYCFQAFHEIRQAHPKAEIALLIRPGFAGFAKAMPWFDRLIIDDHPKGLLGWVRLMGRIRAFRPSRIYDLQGKRRQTLMFYSLGGPLGPEWSGPAPLAHLPRIPPDVTAMHFTQFIATQLRMAGVLEAGPADLGWLDAPIGHLNLPQQFAAVIPGCTPKAGYKRWPPEHYAEIAARLDLPCVVVGTKDDAPYAEIIKAKAPATIDLTGKTSLFELAGVLRAASFAVGNDTGPMHMASMLGTPTLALFSQSTSPPWSHPLGAHADWRQSPVIADLPVDEVWSALKALPRKG